MPTLAQTLLANTRDNPEWEIAFRHHGDNSLVVTVFGPHRPNRKTGQEHKTRPYAGEIVAADDEQAICSVIQRLRQHIMAER